MHEPFPDELDVPYGLVTTRLLFKSLPVWGLALCLALGILPLYLWGRHAWWATVLAGLVGIVIGKLAYDDPEFLQAYVGQLRLKDYYD